jgi:CheY-like chemotaxis protein
VGYREGRERFAQGIEARLNVPLNPSQRNDVEQVADAAARQLVPKALQQVGPLLKVLWVDEHPQNNIGLQYAFQALGMIVICIDTNAGIPAAFTTAKGFDVVITDIGRPGDPRGGFKTIEIIGADHSGTPVIVYTTPGNSQRYQGLGPPVIAVTDSPQKVFTEVTSMAARATSKR